MPKYDVTILTDHRYVNPKQIDQYVQNVLDEDQYVMDALKNVGLNVNRVSWDDKDYNWDDSLALLFRTTWDYFDRFDEFNRWLESVRHLQLINNYELIQWSLDKNYLRDINMQGIRIPNTVFIKKGNQKSLFEHAKKSGWNKFVLKPAVAGAARHTYLFDQDGIVEHEAIFNELIQNEGMLLQEFQENIISKGEISLMMFGNNYSHAVIKKAKKGDFRVQDDFGGTVEDYEASNKEILFAKTVVNACKTLPVYARIDLIWDNNDNLAVSELELIEPELWFRKNPQAADLLVEQMLLNMERKHKI